MDITYSCIISVYIDKKLDLLLLRLLPKRITHTHTDLYYKCNIRVLCEAGARDTMVFLQKSRMYSSRHMAKKTYFFLISHYF